MLADRGAAKALSAVGATSLGARDGSHALRHEVKEGKLAGLSSVLVNESTGQVATKDGSQVAVRDTRDNGLEANLVQQELGQGILEDSEPDRLVGPEVRVLEVLVQVGDGKRELVRQDGARLASLLVFTPDGLELEAGVVLNLGLDLLHVGLVESRSLSSLGVDAHVFDEAGIVKGQRSKDFQRRGSDTTLVGGGILVKDTSSSFEAELGVLGNEQVGTLNNVRDGRLAILDQAVDGDQVNGLRTTTTRNEGVGHASVAEMVSVTERGSVSNDLAVRKSDVVVLNQDAETVLGDLGDVVLTDHSTLLGQTEKLLLVKAVGVSKDTRAVNNGGPLLVTEEDFVASQVTIGTTGLHLANSRGVEVQLAVNSLDVLADG